MSLLTLRIEPEGGRQAEGAAKAPPHEQLVRPLLRRWKMKWKGYYFADRFGVSLSHWLIPWWLELGPGRKLDTSPRPAFMIIVKV